MNITLSEVISNLETAKSFNKEKFLTINRSISSIESMGVTKHLKQEYLYILNKARDVFQLTESREIPNRFFVELFNLINLITGALEDVSSEDINYYNSTSIQKFLISLHNTHNPIENLFKLRAYCGIIFLQLYTVVNRMISVLSTSLAENCDMEMYYGLIQHNNFTDFYNLIFLCDLDQLFDTRTNSTKMQMLRTDIEIYEYAYFVSSISEILYDETLKAYLEIDIINRILLMIFLSNGNYVFISEDSKKQNYNDFIKGCLMEIFTKADFRGKVENWMLYKIMKIFSMNYKINSEFLSYVRVEILAMILSQCEDLPVRCNNRNNRERPEVWKERLRNEISKYKTFLKLVLNFSWLELKENSKELEPLTNNIRLLTEELKK